MFLPFHCGQDGLRREQRPLQIEIMAAVPVVLGHIVKHDFPEYPGVVYQDIDPAKSFQCGSGYFFVVQLTADVGDDKNGVAAGIPNLLD